MKKVLSSFLLVILCSVCFTQNIVVTIAPRGEVNLIKWNVEYNVLGLITKCEKIDVISNEILEKLTVQEIESGFLSEYIVKALFIRNIILQTEKGLDITSRVQNSINGSDKISQRIVNQVEKEFIDKVNNSVVFKYEIQSQKLFDGKGKMVSERKGNIIYNYVDENTINISFKTGFIELKKEMIPSIVPATVIKISGNINDLKKSLLFNYAVIPYELQFLVFLM